MADKYFATLPAKECADELLSKVKNWQSATVQGGLHRKWWKSYRYYYGRHFTTGAGYPYEDDIIRGGDKGELASFGINHYQSILKHIHILATNQNPSFDARAINSDADSLQQAKVANNVLDAYVKTKGLGRYLSNAAEQALIFGTGYVFSQWNPNKSESGTPYTFKTATEEDGSPKVNDEGQPVEYPVYSGLAEFHNPSVFDVFNDESSEDWKKIQWVNVRLYENKFDLAVTYPELKEILEGLDTKEMLEGMQSYSFSKLNLSSDVPMYYFFHKRTKSLPNGRLIIYVHDGTVLYDGPTPYKSLPVFRIVPTEIHGVTHGYTPGFDLLPIQEAYNVINSSIFTNQQALAIQKIWIPEGGNITSNMISKGLAVIRGPAGAEPKALQLTASASECFNYLTLLEQAMEKISGVSSVLRGDPEKNLKSGVALSLVQSMATQYMSGFQQSYAKLLEDVGTFLIYLLQSFAKEEQMIAFAGKNFSGYLEKFVGSDVSKIDRVVVDVGNPMKQTLAGRFDMATMLKDMGMLKTPQDLISVLETGSLDRAIEGGLKRADLVKSENERLMEGKPCQALVGDSHLYHVQTHLDVLADPSLREKADMGDQMAMMIMQNVQAHIQQHFQLYATQDPMWAAVSGEPPAPQPQMMPPSGPEQQGLPPSAIPPQPGQPPQ